MTRNLAILVLLAAIACLSPLRESQAQQKAAASDLAKATSEMADAATKFINSLTPEQQAKAVFTFKDGERTNWHFTPVTRKGLPWKDMTAPQRELGHALMLTGMSRMAYDKAEMTEQNEFTLGAMENATRAGSGDRRDPDNYYISIFGKPGPADPWGWRFEGHHVAFNFTVDQGMITAVASPNFFGSNPAKVPEGRPNAGRRILAAEEDLGRALIRGLSDEQRKIAIITETAPKEIITGEQQRPDPIKPAGITGDKLSADHKKMLMAIVNEYIARQRPELAKQDLDKIEKAGGVDKLWFAWAGTIEVGGPHYYRVQGPTFLIEYDNTQNNNNHVHAVWRDAANDFGEDLLKKHYAEHPAEHQ